ncbi:hypothetical protein [Methylobacterium phyllosphaerae]|uniref:hypothetical protein n=1 Tax=Methylobacterium phyllosphaerae TaxID=418223 RepID=UPI00094C0979|nr:hypothetical protein [Methylobacterium phyllosphaerae]
MQTWRKSEREINELLSKLVAGELPDSKLYNSDELRRLGYLAEVALFLLEPRDADALSGFVDRIRALEPVLDQSTIALIPWNRSRPYPRGLDEIADRWNISPGIDIGRFRSEVANSTHLD